MSEKLSCKGEETFISTRVQIERKFGKQHPSLCYTVKQGYIKFVLLGDGTRTAENTDNALNLKLQGALKFTDKYVLNDGKFMLTCNSLVDKVPAPSLSGIRNCSLLLNVLFLCKRKSNLEFTTTKSLS